MYIIKDTSDDTYIQSIHDGRDFCYRRASNATRFNRFTVLLMLNVIKNYHTIVNTFIDRRFEDYKVIKI
jgi:hypothetical protein